MAAISDADVSIDANGNIRWEGAATTNRHSVLEFIQWLMDKQDDEQASGNDLLDITVDTPFDRSTDQIVTLNSPFNIDDTFAAHLYDGSVSQTEPVVGGETLYAGLRVIGPCETGTEYMILQDGKVLPSFWGTGINPEASPSLVFSRHLVKVKVAGCQIDGQKVTVLARELGDQYRRFPVTFGTGNSVAAIGNGSDIFNETADATIASWTTIVNTEGFQELDIDGTGASGQEFYSKWDLGSETILNRIYERTKWISQRSHEADSTGGTPTGADFVIDNATITGQAQSFIPLAGSEKLTEARFNIKIGAGAPTGTIYAELFDSDDASPAAPTGSALARSEPVLASAITSSYEEVIFRFNLLDPSDGSDQQAGLTLSNAEYFIALRHDDGDASNYFHVQGASTDQDATMNQADDTAGWSGSATDDLDVTVKSSPVIHGVPGELFQGINVEVGFDGEVGTGVAEDNILMWGTRVVYDTLSGGPFYPGEYVTIKDTGTLVSGAKVLYDDGTDELILMLDTPGASVIGDGDDISTVRGASEATCKINATVEDEEKSGGTGILLAKDDNGADGELYLQVLSGENPVDNNVIRRDDTSGDPLADYCLATSTINTRTVSPEFVGTSTGSNIIGAYGIGYDPNDVGSSDRFTDLANASRVPPNNVTFTVSGLVSGEDRVLVGPRSGSALDRGMWLLSTALTGGSEVAVVVKTGSETVPWVASAINWPSGSSGNEAALRIELDSGIYRRLDYVSHDGSGTFTIASTSFVADPAAVDNDVFLAFIDALAGATTESFTGVHGGVDRDLFVRVRDGGATPIKTFESTSAQFLGTPVTIAAIRTSDA
jgi:hypothetical protein